MVSTRRMKDILSITGHRPWPLPRAPWAMTQRWNDLLFAHWPVEATEITPLLPAHLAVDTFDGSAWVGVVPFWMDQVRLRGLPSIPGTNRFPELNLRTYVRERNTNLAGVWFFSLDAANPLAVMMARTFFRLPYYWAKMSIQETHPEATGIAGREFHYRSERRLASRPVRFEATYRSLGRPHPNRAIEPFLTERYALYTTDRHGETFRGNVHHLPWPLEEAEAEFTRNELPEAHGIHLPEVKPLLHYSRELVVYVWPLEMVPAFALGAAGAPVPAAP
jgi:uncharacterized protein YqjF (DUF2071 family)